MSDQNVIDLEQKVNSIIEGYYNNRDNNTNVRPYPSDVISNDDKTIPIDSGRNMVCNNLYYHESYDFNMFAHYFKIQFTYGDGTCLIHSILTSLSTLYRQLPMGNNHEITLRQLLGVKFRVEHLGNENTWTAENLEQEYNTYVGIINNGRNVQDTNGNIMKDIKYTLLTDDQLTLISKLFKFNVFVIINRTENDCELMDIETEIGYPYILMHCNIHHYSCVTYNDKYVLPYTSSDVTKIKQIIYNVLEQNGSEYNFKEIRDAIINSLKPLTPGILLDGKQSNKEPATNSLSQVPVPLATEETTTETKILQLDDAVKQTNKNKTQQTEQLKEFLKNISETNIEEYNKLKTNNLNDNQIDVLYSLNLNQEQTQKYIETIKSNETNIEQIIPKLKEMGFNNEPKIKEIYNNLTENEKEKNNTNIISIIIEKLITTPYYNYFQITFTTRDDNTAGVKNFYYCNVTKIEKPGVKPTEKLNIIEKLLEFGNLKLTFVENGNYYYIENIEDNNQCDINEKFLLFTAIGSTITNIYYNNISNIFTNTNQQLSNIIAAASAAVVSILQNAKSTKNNIENTKSNIIASAATAVVKVIQNAKSIEKANSNISSVPNKDKAVKISNSQTSSFLPGVGSRICVKKPINNNDKKNEKYEKYKNFYGKIVEIDEKTNIISVQFFLPTPNEIKKIYVNKKDNTIKLAADEYRFDERKLIATFDDESDYNKLIDTFEADELGYCWTLDNYKNINIDELNNNKFTIDNFPRPPGTETSNTK